MKNFILLTVFSLWGINICYSQTVEQLTKEVEKLKNENTILQKKLISVGYILSPINMKLSPLTLILK